MYYNIKLYCIIILNNEINMGKIQGKKICM